MIPGLIHDNPFDYFWSLIVDVVIFMIKSIYFFAEMAFLTILPNRLRKMKVGLLLVKTFCVSNVQLKRKYFLLPTHQIM